MPFCLHTVSRNLARWKPSVAVCELRRAGCILFETGSEYTLPRILAGALPRWEKLEPSQLQIPLTLLLLLPPPRRLVTCQKSRCVRRQKMSGGSRSHWKVFTQDLTRGCPWLKTFSACGYYLPIKGSTWSTDLIKGLITSVALGNKPARMTVAPTKCWENLSIQKKKKSNLQTSVVCKLVVFCMNMQLPDASVSSVFACYRRSALTIIKHFSNLRILCNPMRRKGKYFSRGGLPEGLDAVPEWLIVCQLIHGAAHDILQSD